MKKRIVYTDEPSGKLRIIKDFLPPPEVLAHSPVRVKVTIALSKSSVDYFKKVAQKYHTPYQTIMRRLIDAYAAGHPLP